MWLCVTREAGGLKELEKAVPVGIMADGILLAAVIWGDFSEMNSA